MVQQGSLVLPKFKLSIFGFSIVHGFLNLNKPEGFTSHDCVAKVRGILKLKRVGHAGTLDPAATGVLPIALGKATRLLQYLPGHKAYHATIRLGIRTATDDLAGEIRHSQAVPGLELATVKAALPQFQGVLQQIPPDYSAIQVQGKRLYDLARSGIEIDAKPRQVEVFSLDVLDWRSGDFPELELAIACGSGTYIRAIARDLGAMLGVGGTLAALIRTNSSGFALADSLTLETVASQVQQGKFQPIAPEVAVAQLEAIVLPNEIARRWCQGQKVLTDAGSEQILRVHGMDDRFLGIGNRSQPDDEFVLLPQMVYAAE